MPSLRETLQHFDQLGRSGNVHAQARQLAVWLTELADRREGTFTDPWGVTKDESDRVVPWEPMDQITPEQLPDSNPDPKRFPTPWKVRSRGNGHEDIVAADGTYLCHVYCWYDNDFMVVLEKLARINGDEVPASVIRSNKEKPCVRCGEPVTCDAFTVTVVCITCLDLVLARWAGQPKPEWRRPGDSFEVNEALADHGAALQDWKLANPEGEET